MSRLTPERTTELYTGVLRLVVEHGYDNLTMDAIASVTHTGKATLYRQWGSKQGLVLAALLGLADEIDDGQAIPNTGTLAGDLHAFVARKPDEAEDFVEFCAAISYAMRRDRDLAEAFRQKVVSRWEEWIDQMLARAVDRGEIVADAPALRFCHEIFMAPQLYSDLLLGTDPALSYFHDYIEAVILPVFGVTPNPTRRES